MPNMKIYLDDNRACPEGWELVKNFEEFALKIGSSLKNNKGFSDIEAISFDHDLAYEHYSAASILPTQSLDLIKFKEKTGFDCAMWLISKLIEYGVKPDETPHFIVHSYNPVGAQRIAVALQNYYQVYNAVFNPETPYESYKFLLSVQIKPAKAC